MAVPRVDAAYTFSPSAGLSPADLARNPVGRREAHNHIVPVGGNNDIKNVGPTNLGGSSILLARADHVHQGVHSLNMQGNGTLVGDLLINQGQGITITNVGQATTIAGNTTGFGDLTNSDIQNVGPTDIASVSGGAVNKFAFADHVHQGVHSLNMQGNGTLVGDLSINQGSGITITNVGNATTIAGNTALGDLTNGDIKSVGPANIASVSGGAIGKFAFADHVHQGVHSTTYQGSGTLVGDIIVNQGANITITNVGNTVTIAAAGGSGGLNAFGYAAGQNDTVIGANADVVFDLGATPFPNSGFTSVPAPGGTTFVIASSGIYEFNFYVAGTHASGATTSLEFALWRNGAVASVGGNAFEFRSNQQGGAGDVQVCRGQGIILLTAADTITLHNRTNTVTDAVTVTSIPPGGEAGPNRTLCLKKLN
jgi:hypothetical protein